MNRIKNLAKRFVCDCKGFADPIFVIIIILILAIILGAAYYFLWG